MGVEPRTVVVRGPMPTSVRVLVVGFFGVVGGAFVLAAIVSHATHPEDLGLFIVPAVTGVGLAAFGFFGGVLGNGGVSVVADEQGLRVHKPLGRVWRFPPGSGVRFVDRPYGPTFWTYHGDHAVWLRTGPGQKERYVYAPMSAGRGVWNPGEISHDYAKLVADLNELASALDEDSARS
jgi:hypothetical protein